MSFFRATVRKDFEPAPTRPPQEPLRGRRQNQRQDSGQHATCFYTSLEQIRDPLLQAPRCCFPDLRGVLGRINFFILKPHVAFLRHQLLGITRDWWPCDWTAVKSPACCQVHVAPAGHITDHTARGPASRVLSHPSFRPPICPHWPWKPGDLCCLGTIPWASWWAC